MGGLDNSSTRYNNIFGCIQTRLGGNMSGNLHKGAMVSHRENVAHKCSRARSSEVSHPFIYSLPGSVISPSLSGQHDSSIILEHGRNPERTVDQDFKTNLVLSVRETNLSDSRICSQYRQSFGRLGISQFSGQQRMETLPNVIQNNLQKIWDPTCRSICIPSLPPASTIHVMATRSAEHSNRCITSGLEESVLLCFPPIFPIRSSVKKSSEKPDQIDYCYARLVEPILVPDFVENGNCRPIPFTQTSKDSFEPRRQNPSFSSELNSEVSGMAGVRKNLSSEGTSERAIDLISNSRR